MTQTSMKMLRLCIVFLAVSLVACAHSEDCVRATESDQSEQKPNLLVIVGRKIHAKYVPPPKDVIRFDAVYEAQFEVLDVVFGDYNGREIPFLSSVHVSEPKYLKHEYGVLYLSLHEGQYYQQKYLFQPVYPTVDGRWAGCGDPYEGMPEIHRHGVEPEPIEFSPPTDCEEGNYPPELFQVMKEGYLKYRGVFGPPPGIAD